MQLTPFARLQKHLHSILENCSIKDTVFIIKLTLKNIADRDIRSNFGRCDIMFNTVPLCGQNSEVTFQTFCPLRYQLLVNKLKSRHYVFSSLFTKYRANVDFPTPFPPHTRTTEDLESEEMSNTWWEGSSTKAFAILNHIRVLTFIWHIKFRIK